MAFVFGEADAAGDGLTEGLGLLAVPVGVEGEGLAVVVELELSTGSVAQPAKKTSENTVRSNRAVRLIVFKFDEVISVLPHFSKMEKHADNCPVAK
ncbi:MAG TPA: hypothetical protein VIF64_19045 [Pyrinomonadaceae bacterium]